MPDPRRAWLLFALLLLALAATACAPVGAPAAATAAATAANAAAQIRVEQVWSQPAILLEAADDVPCTDDATGQAQASDAMTQTMAHTMAHSVTHNMADLNPCGEMDHEMAMADAGSRGVVYMMIANDGAEPDRLTGVETDVAMAAELHQTTMDGAGLMQMRALADGLELSPGGQVILEPGGIHVMLLGLNRALAIGDSFELTLTFEQSGPLVVTSQVRLP